MHITRMIFSIFAVAFTVTFFSIPKNVYAYNPTELVVNGGFEADPLGTGWVQTPSGLIGAWTGLSWHGGYRGAFLGGANSVYDILGQARTIPANATSATLTYWYQWGTSETNMSACYDYVQIDVLNLSDVSEIASTTTLCSNGVTNWGTWTQATVDVTSLKGKTAYVRFIVNTDSTDHSGLIIDDVSLVYTVPDVTAPTTTATINPPSPNGTNGIYTIVPTITFNATDDAGGSGVAATFYSWDGAPYTQYTGALTAPEGVHTFYYQSRDNAGNTETAKTMVINVDTSTPGITLSSPTADSTVTNKEVTVSGAASDSSGIQSILVNGVAVSVQPGNLFSTILTLVLGQNPITITAIDGAGNSASHAVVVTFKQPTPRVLGISTSRPTIESGKLVGRKFSYTLNGKKITITPFAVNYKGAIWARKIDFGSELGVVYLFAPLDTLPKARLMAYNKQGKVLNAGQPFGSSSTGNYRLKIITQPSTDTVFLVVMSKSDAKTVRVYEVTSKGLTNRSNLLTGQKSNAGEIVAQFLKIYNDDYGLVTALPGKPKTIRVWKHDAGSSRFVQDKTFNVKLIKLSGSNITLK